MATITIYGVTYTLIDRHIFISGKQPSLVSFIFDTGSEDKVVELYNQEAEQFYDTWVSDDQVIALLKKQLGVEDTTETILNTDTQENTKE